MGAGQQAARVTDPVTHGLGMLGIIGGMLIGAVVGAILIVSLPVTAPALVVGLTAAAAVGAVAGGGLAGHQLLQGIQRACALPSPATGIIGIVGSVNVRVGNLPAARVIADMAIPCNGLMSLNHIPIPPMPPAPIAEGSQTIRINNLLAARVTSKLVCGASIKQGALTVYYGGPTQRVLAVFDLESIMMSALGFLAKASLIAMAILTIPLGIGAVAMFAAVFGGFMAVNYGLGVLGDKMGPGWKDILQGGFGLSAIVGGAMLGPKALESEEPLSQVELAQQRQAQMLADNRGYNISPSSWDSYPSIGRNGTFLTDQQGITDVLGDLPKDGSDMTITSEQASQLEQSMGLDQGSLQDGFKIRQVDGIQDMSPRSPLTGNSQFQGPGQHLPGGAPEMVVNSIPTTDGPGVTTITNVNVQH
jgi:uncharacterized Zn-binding protein involved in type VI secretion